MSLKEDVQTRMTHHEVVELIPALRAFSRTFCRNETDADDLVQETLAKALANLDKYQSGTRLKSWLFTIMRNTFYSQIKVTNREMPGAERCVGEIPFNEATQDWSCRGHELIVALEKLPPEYREIVMLVTVLGESYADAARTCDCAIGTVKSRLNRARHLLMIELDHHAETGR